MSGRRGRCGRSCACSAASADEPENQRERASPPAACRGRGFALRLTHFFARANGNAEAVRCSFRAEADPARQRPAAVHRLETCEPLLPVRQTLQQPARKAKSFLLICSGSGKAADCFSPAADLQAVSVLRRIFSVIKGCKNRKIARESCSGGYENGKGLVKCVRLCYTVKREFSLQG